MISDRGMASLRVAATLAHVLPGLGARVRHGDLVVLDVEPVAPGARLGEEHRPVRVEGERRLIAPGAFRCAVGRAHQRRLAGESMRFLDLQPGCEPVVDIGVPPTGAGRPGGLYRVPFAGRWLWGMASTIDPSVAFSLGTDLVEDAMPMLDVRALGIRPDPATDVSLMFAETDATPVSSSEADLLELFETLLARWTAHDLMQHVEGAPDITETARPPWAAGRSYPGSA